MKRRELMLSMSAGAGAALGLGACRTVPDKPTAPAGPRPALIDIHAHVFNASDLPVIRFIKIVFLKHYPREAVSVLNVDDPDALDQLIALLTFLVGRTSAPGAAQEIRVLNRQEPLEKVNAVAQENDKAMVLAIADFLGGKGAAAAGAGGPVRIDKIQRAIRRAGAAQGVGVQGGGAGGADGDLATAYNAYHSLDLGLVLRWFALFTRYRHSLAEQLAHDHERQGFSARLLCPALVDYDHWLGERPTSSLTEQVAVMGRIARRPTGPRVHGYVAFDPLRQVAWENGISPGGEAPLALVRRALRDEGFIGVKLYPPMGYRAMGNANTCQAYPGEQNKAMERLLELGPKDEAAVARCPSPRPHAGGPALGRRLDAALSQLFDLCVKERGVVMAHANDSNGANEQYSGRADPAHWLEVFQRWPDLHVALAHFGSFDAESVAKPVGATGAEASWEWTLGRYLREHPRAPVYADISYLVEIIGRGAAEQARYDQVMQAWVRQFDPECHHLMFGTDWMMLGLDKGYPDYTERVYQYFRHRMGFDDAMLERLFSANAGAFLGLRRNDPMRERLLGFYRRHGIPEHRLPEMPSG
jgi:predicted TIM-barrel fold metal-dependent hydrolase